MVMVRSVHLQLSLVYTAAENNNAPRTASASGLVPERHFEETGRWEDHRIKSYRVLWSKGHVRKLAVVLKFYYELSALRYMPGWPILSLVSVDSASAGFDLAQPSCLGCRGHHR